MGKHDHKRAQVEKMLDENYTVTEICSRLNIPDGSRSYLLAKWGLLHKQVRQTGNYSAATRQAWSQNYKGMLRAGKISGENHWSHGRLKLRGRWVPQGEAKAILEELVAQDMILAQMAEECETDPRTITNWLKRFDMQRGIRKGNRCSWWKGGHEKYRGPGWLTVRAEILERDGHKCQHCGMTQEEARARGHGLSVHHIASWRETHDNSPANLLSLCQSCHMKAEPR